MVYRDRQTALRDARARNAACRRSGSPILHRAVLTRRWSMRRLCFVPCWTVVLILK